MNIALLTVGTRGDAQPYVALARGLQAAGHAVTVATHDEHATLVREHGLSFRSLAGNPRALMESETGRAWNEAGSNPIRFFRHFSALYHSIVDEMARSVLAACAGADAVIFSTLAILSAHAAEKLGIPSLWAPLQPVTRTREFPAMLVSPDRTWGPLNPLSYLVNEQIGWQPMRNSIQRWRAAWGLAPISFWGPYAAIERGTWPVAYGYSRHVLPVPADWAGRPWMEVCGYWFSDPPPGWQPPAALADFIASGAPPVYVGFGSMMNRDPAGTTTLVLEAIKRSGRRAVVLTGWSGIGRRAWHADVFVTEGVPHAWLFPQMAAVVHHGGAGTSAAAFRAGVPAVNVPFFADQPFWARRAQRLGVAAEPIPRARLTVERLADAITRAAGDAEMARRARNLGAQVSAEDGVGNAVHFIERAFARTR